MGNSSEESAKEQDAVTEKGPLAAAPAEEEAGKPQDVRDGTGKTGGETEKGESKNEPSVENDPIKEADPNATDGNDPTNAGASSSGADQTAAEGTQKSTESDNGDNPAKSSDQNKDLKTENTSEAKPSTEDNVQSAIQAEATAMEIDEPKSSSNTDKNIDAMEGVSTTEGSDSSKPAPKTSENSDETANVTSESNNKIGVPEPMDGVTKTEVAETSKTDEKSSADESKPVVDDVANSEAAKPPKSDDESNANGQANKKKYPLFSVVYKLFEDDWYFGFVEKFSSNHQWYCVRYEDGDKEDLDEKQMEEYVVTLDNGEVALASPTSADGEEPMRKPNNKSGTADIGTYDESYRNLDREALNRYIERRKQAEKDAIIEARKKQLEAKRKQQRSKESPTKRKEAALFEARPFPSFELGTIVYKYFNSNWFFGFVGRIDNILNLYGVKYEDGDKEEMDEEELSKIVVRTEEGLVAKTAKNPEQEIKWEEDEYKEVLSPGNPNIVSTDKMYSNLDRVSLVRYMRKRQIEHEEAESKKNRKRRPFSSPQQKRMRTSNDSTRVVASPKPKGTPKSLFDKSTGKLSENVCDFFRFLHERQSIWVRINTDEWLPSPGETEAEDKLVLTYDEVLRYYSFCNVYRELDRGTAYFHSHVLKLRESKPDWEAKDWLFTVLWAAYVYRQVNRLETFEAIGIPLISEVDEFKLKAERHHKKAKAFFTNAHQTTQFGTFLNNLRNGSRNDGKIIREVADELYKAKSRRECLEVLQKLDSVGRFMSWQILCDLLESGCLSQCRDENYCLLGPGALKGLDILFSGGDYLVDANLLVTHQDEAFQQIGVKFPFWNGRKISIKEIEHALCEYSKYISLKKKGGNRKSRLYISRANMDLDKPCHFCEQAKDEGKICDTCLGFYCNDCEPVVQYDSSSRSVSWICSRCKSFEAEFGLTVKDTVMTDVPNGSSDISQIIGNSEPDIVKTEVKEVKSGENGPDIVESKDNVLGDNNAETDKNNAQSTINEDNKSTHLLSEVSTTKSVEPSTTTSLPVSGDKEEKPRPDDPPESRAEDADSGSVSKPDNGESSMPEAPKSTGADSGKLPQSEDKEETSSMQCPAEVPSETKTNDATLSLETEETQTGQEPHTETNGSDQKESVESQS